MQTWENQDGELKHTVNIEQIGKNDIPLYTHPAKDNYRETHEGFSTVIDAAHPAKTLTDTDLTLILEVLIDSYDDTNRGFLEYEAIWKNSATRKAKIDGMKRMVDKHTHAIEMVEAILRKAQEK